MKWNELIRLAQDNGWYLQKHGKKHDVYIHAESRERIIIGRHGSDEVPIGTCVKILKQMGLYGDMTN